MLYLWDLFFIIIYHIISLKQTHLFFARFLEYLKLVLGWMITWMKKVNIFQIAKVQPESSDKKSQTGVSL